MQDLACALDRSERVADPVRLRMALDVRLRLYAQFSFAAMLVQQTLRS